MMNRIFKRKNDSPKEILMYLVFLSTASVSVIAVFLICLFLFANGMPAMGTIGFGEFLLGEEWKPGNDRFGIFSMLVGSLTITFGAVCIGVPVGVLTAVFFSHFCPKAVYRFLKPAVDLLAGIPSIVYGFFGLVVLVPWVRVFFGGTGTGMLTASVLLGIMILPSVIAVSESALQAVPKQYYEGSLALGATPERSVFCVVLPAAKSGIFAGIVLGIGRAVGETMAVMMVAGNQARVPDEIVDGVRTLTTNIVLEMGYAADLHREALIATAVVLFVMILLMNLIFAFLKRREW